MTTTATAMAPQKPMTSLRLTPMKIVPPMIQYGKSAKRSHMFRRKGSGSSILTRSAYDGDQREKRKPLVCK